VNANGKQQKNELDANNHLVQAQQSNNKQNPRPRRADTLWAVSVKQTKGAKLLRRL